MNFKSLFRSLLVMTSVLGGSTNLRAEPVAAPTGKFAVEVYVYSKNHQRPAGAIKQEHIDVYVNGALKYTWLTSTACDCVKKPTIGAPYRPHTPRGTFRFQRGVEKEVSRQFNNAAMNYALYFGPRMPSGIAIHATYGAGVKTLGQPASAGCVRLEEIHAQTLFNLVMKDVGLKNAQVTVSDLQDKTEMYPLTR